MKVCYYKEVLLLLKFKLIEKGMTKSGYSSDKTLVAE